LYARRDIKDRKKSCVEQVVDGLIESEEFIDSSKMVLKKVHEA
jgi:hypothetical protein